MKTIFKNPRIFQRMHDGPLGSYVESYAAEMREQGYCTGAMESQIRLVADFSRWMMKTQSCKTYLRCRARFLRPKRDDRAALNRLLTLLLRQRIIVEPSLPAATPANEVQTEFGRYLCRERGLVSTTVNCYGSFAGKFLADRFGTGPLNLSLLHLCLPKTPSELKTQRFRAFMRSWCDHDELFFRRPFRFCHLQFSNPYRPAGGDPRASSPTRGFPKERAAALAPPALRPALVGLALAMVARLAQ